MKKSSQELYLEGQKLANFQPGERVKVAFKVPSDSAGWANSWHPGMDHFIGKQCAVVSEASGHGVRVECRELGDWFSFPWFCLERVKPEPVEVKLNESCTATVVSETEVKVGCQTFEVSRLRELLNACEKFTE